jgi:D-alanyl-lipoteichoic acid acyltransferase DltB (MBOAT superfamily)
MLFNSLGYLLFLLVAFVVTVITPRRYRYVWWGVMSVLFYSMWRWEFTFLLVLNSLFDYCFSRAIASTQRTGWRRLWLVLDLILNFGMLIGFKYSYFLYHQAWRVGQWTGWPPLASPTLPLDIILPLGISFYTFQTVSYTIDVYRGITVPVRNFWLYLTYVNYWPQLIAGPILRADEVLQQLRMPRAIRSGDVAAGVRRILIGIGRKVLIADLLAPMVERAFDMARQPGFSALDAWSAAILFGFQIYADFAGYSDIALGTARMFGIRFPENFNWPYMALSPRDFWKRWHISLSSWVRDYLYLPLMGRSAETSHSTGGIGLAAGGAEGEGGRRTIALFLTWFLMGLWHGAGWTFAVWGVYHATAIYVFRRVAVLRRLPESNPRLAWLVTLAVAMASWIPFRAQSMSLTLHLFKLLTNPLAYLRTPMLGVGTLSVVVAMVGGMMLLQRVQQRMGNRHDAAYGLLRMLAYAGLATALILRLRPVEQFIYFQF